MGRDRGSVARGFMLDGGSHPFTAIPGCPTTHTSDQRCRVRVYTRRSRRDRMFRRGCVERCGWDVIEDVGCVFTRAVGVDDERFRCSWVEGRGWGAIEEPFARVYVAWCVQARTLRLATSTSENR